MKNLLEETKEDIEYSGHKPEDIIFIGSLVTGHSCTWKEFVKLANVNYDSGFGAPEVATDLIIAFSDKSTMWRGEYDGSEWWEYQKPFDMPEHTKKIHRLITKNIGWDTLEEINKDED